MGETVRIPRNQPIFKEWWQSIYQRLAVYLDLVSIQQEIPIRQTHESYLQSEKLDRVGRNSPRQQTEASWRP